jgi:hypothetical protein
MYKTILAVVEVIQQGLRKSQRKTLAAVLEGLLARSKCSLAEIARGIGRRCQFASRLKQVWRYVNNKNIEPEEVAQGILDWFISSLSPGQPLVLLVDWTEFLGDHLLSAAIPLEKRAIPVFWRLASHAEYHDEWGRNLLEDKFFRELRHRIPESVSVIIIADRGFGRTELFRKLDKLGFRFIIRVKDDVWIRTQAWQGVLAGYPLEFGKIIRLDQVQYRQKKSMTLSLVARWDKVRGKYEAWYLATNCPDEAAGIIGYYEKRMWIDEMYRDVKSQHFALDRTKVKTTKGRDRLLAAIAIAILLASFVGLQCLANQLDVPALGNKKSRGFSILSLGLEALKTLGRKILAATWIPKLKVAIQNCP